LTGIRVGPFTDLAGLYITEKNRRRAKEEQKRVLYVAMTRPREHLIISCGPGAQRSTGSFQDILDEALNDQIGAAAQSTVLDIGQGKVEIEIVEASLTAPGRAKAEKTIAEKKRDWRPYLEAWEGRRKVYEAALETPVFVTPTLLKQQEENLVEAAPKAHPLARGRTPAMLVGELTHRLLESWDFMGGKENFAERRETLLDQWLPEEFRRDRALIEADITEIFTSFLGSEIYAELATSQILGREVPLLIPWNGQIMEGVIDLIYERDGLLYLADYKTDRIDRSGLAQAAQQYYRQAEAYSRAARQSLSREIEAFKIIFLRLGEAIRIVPDARKEISHPVQLQLL